MRSSGFGFGFGRVLQAVVDERADSRIGRGVKLLPGGELRGLPVAQALGFRDPLSQHDGRHLAQALLFDAPFGYER